MTNEEINAMTEVEAQAKLITLEHQLRSLQTLVGRINQRVQHDLKAEMKQFTERLRAKYVGRVLSYSSGEGLRIKEVKFFRIENLIATGGAGWYSRVELSGQQLTVWRMRENGRSLDKLLSDHGKVHFTLKGEEILLEDWEFTDPDDDTFQVETSNLAERVESIMRAYELAPEPAAAGEASA